MAITPAAIEAALQKLALFLVSNTGKAEQLKSPHLKAFFDEWETYERLVIEVISIPTGPSLEDATVTRLHEETTALGQRLVALCNKLN